MPRPSSLAGPARLLIIGQDPATHEAIARRVTVGEAGQRAQGLLTRLGIDRSYVFINTFLYSVYGQSGGSRHIDDPAITTYRNRWIDAIVADQHIEAIITLGQLANSAYQQWRATPKGSASTAAYATIATRRIRSQRVVQSVLARLKHSPSCANPGTRC